jgi:hypothetical protein
MQTLGESADTDARYLSSLSDIAAAINAIGPPLNGLPQPDAGTEPG